MAGSGKKTGKRWLILAGLALLCVGVVLLVVWGWGEAVPVEQEVRSGQEVVSKQEEVSEKEDSVPVILPEEVSSQTEPEPEPPASVAVPLPPEEDPAEESGYLIADFPIVYQLPQLPTGCEITSLTMVLQYYGLEADKEKMAAGYLPTSPSTNRYTGSDGRVYGIDLDAYFVGNPFDEDSGMICGPAAIVTAANGYLTDQGSSLRAADYTGTQPEELYALVEQNIPVVVWVTIGITPRQPARSGWYTESGKYVDWTNNDHCAVLVGYTDTSVWVADPLAGLAEYDREAFEEVFASRSNRCVVLQ